jgi:hypothetical protein
MSDIGFVRSDVRTVASAAVAWWTGLEHIGRVEQREVVGSLDALVGALEPLDTVTARRHLLLPTDGPWTAVVTNNWRGEGAGSIASVVAEDLAVNALRVLAVEDGTAFELSGPGGRGPALLIRTVWAIAEDGHWEFGADGSPQPFERLEYYTRRRVEERFPPKLLEAYCRALGIRPFDEDFYAPDRRAALIATPDRVTGQRTLSLAEARAELGFL